MNEQTNPYSAPSTVSDAVRASGSNRQVDFVVIMKRWERLRFTYNGILIFLVLVLSFAVFPARASLAEYWFSVCFGGLIANVCFTLGPTCEAYGTCFQFWNPVFTILLFLAGLGLTAILAIFCIATFPKI